MQLYSIATKKEEKDSYGCGRQQQRSHPSHLKNSKRSSDHLSVLSRGGKTRIARMPLIWFKKVNTYCNAGLFA